MDGGELEDAMEALARRIVEGDDYDPYEVWGGEDTVSFSSRAWTGAGLRI